MDAKQIQHRLKFRAPFTHTPTTIMKYTCGGVCIYLLNSSNGWNIPVSKTVMDDDSYDGFADYNVMRTLGHCRCHTPATQSYKPHDGPPVGTPY